MWHPAHIDGRTVVVLKPCGSVRGGYEVMESGRLAFTGEELLLVNDRGRRIVTQEELEALQPVAEGNRIAGCRGFGFFLMRGER